MIMIAGIVLTVYVLMIGFLIGFWLLVKQKEKRLNDKTKKIRRINCHEHQKRMKR